MTASEFAFLFMGLVLGVLAGAALVEVLRARPPVPREVRVTVAMDAVPRRASTLANAALTSVSAEPARGGPADRRTEPIGPPAGMPDRRTPVLVPTSMSLALGGAPVGAAPVGDPITRGAERVGVAVRGGTDPLLVALRTSAVTGTVKAMLDPMPTAIRHADPTHAGAGLERAVSHADASGGPESMPT